ncbi:MAG: glycoside hydrolase family 65 protein [Carbonactinosporaceae bacterium]
MSEWVLLYEGFDPAREGLREALCTLGNGFFATRGATPEARADDIHYPGTYVAGCYNRLTSRVGGHTVTNEDIVNAPSWLPLTFRVDDGGWFEPGNGELLDHRLELDMGRGVLSRVARHRSSAGQVTRVTQRRLVSMDHPHLAGLETTITPENWSGRLQVRSALDGRVTNAGVTRYRALNGDHLMPVATGTCGDDVIWLQAETTTSQIRIAEAARTTLRTRQGPAPVHRETHRQQEWIARDLTIDATASEPVTVEKIVALYTSRDDAISESAEAARTWATRAADFDTLLERHVLAWGRLWRRGYVDIDGGDPQRALNLHVFHVLQTLSEHTVDLDVGVPARGLHGEAYRGHVFWDELFVFPYLLLRFPEIARALLLYRWRRLPAAQWAAQQVGASGAMYPWQSGGDGREETQRMHLNPRSGRWLPDHSHRQRHVGLAIAYNVWHYYQTTGDLEFLSEYGAEMLVEVARFFASLATYNHALDRYEIRGVMGPDEYHDAYPGAETPGLDNNAYTNIMAVWVIRRALAVLDHLPQSRSRELCDLLGWSSLEIDRCEEITRKMRVVFHGDGIISQFEGYDKLDEFDWERYRRSYGDIRRLDRILEAESDSPNRYRVSKQADVLMLCYLLSSDDLADLLGRLGYPYDPAMLPRNINYYLARTSHGSTLSAVVHAWVLSRSDRHASWQNFLEAVGSDVSDIQGGTTPEGIHLGAMAGTIDLVQRCYTGLETSEGILRLNPRLPQELGRLAVELRYREHRGIRVSCDHKRVRIELPPDAAPDGLAADVTGGITVVVKDQTTVIQPGTSWDIALTPQPVK